MSKALATAGTTATQAGGTSGRPMGGLMSVADRGRTIATQTILTGSETHLWRDLAG